MKACRENSVATSSYRCEAEAWELKVGSRLGAAIRVSAVNVRSAPRRSHSDAGLRLGPLAANDAVARLPQSAKSGHPTVKTMSRPLEVERAISAALADGNSVAESSIGWTKVKEVVHFRRPMNERVRVELAACGLRHWFAPGTPHDSPSEGFTHDASGIALSFPAPSV